MAAKILGSVGGKTSKGKAASNDPFDVQTVQKLLTSAATRLSKPTLDPGQTDGRISPASITAIESFQKEVMKLDNPDGRIDVNGRTWKRLVKEAGETDTNPEGWPALPSFGALSSSERAKLFGTFEYERRTDSSDEDAIKITKSTKDYQITTVTVPQLAQVKRGHTNVQFHRKAAKQFVALWQAWEDAGLLDRVKTWSGSYVPRFQRGTARVVGVSPLSNHSWGTAFDINPEWNGLNKTPAIIWEEGCVFELVALAHDHGFYWGGHFKSRYDGMHFEVARLV